MAVGPYDFNTNMPDPGQAFAQAFQQAQQQRKEQSRKEQYQQFVQRLRTDRSPETMSEFMLAFPEQADAITKAFEPLDAAKKQSQIGFYGQALSALDRGDVETAKQVVQSRLEAARNTIGSEQEAKELEYGLSMLDSNPDALRDGLASAVFTLDPDRYKALYATGKGELTGFQKDLIAAGVDPTSDEGKAKAKEYVSLKIDPIVQMPTPDGAQFIGRQSEYNRRFGGSSSPTSNMPSPMTKAQYDALAPGTEYYDPRDKQVKRKSGKGGASSNASGGF